MYLIIWLFANVCAAAQPLQDLNFQNWEKLHVNLEGYINYMLQQTFILDVAWMLTSKYKVHIHVL